MMRTLATKVSRKAVTAAMLGTLALAGAACQAEGGTAPGQELPGTGTGDFGTGTGDFGTGTGGVGTGTGSGFGTGS